MSRLSDTKSKLDKLLDSNNLSLNELVDLKSYFEFIISKKLKGKSNQLQSHQSKIKNIDLDVGRVAINIPQYTYDVLLSKTFENEKDPTPTYDAAVHRKMVNYLRHIATSYDGELMFMKEKGVYAEYFHALLKNKVLDGISEKYEWLKPACDLQRSNLANSIAIREGTE